MKTTLVCVLAVGLAALCACGRGGGQGGGDQTAAAPATTVVHDRTVVVPEREDRTVIVREPAARPSADHGTPDRPAPARRPPPPDRDHP
jgi:hypothetical protein